MPHVAGATASPPAPREGLAALGPAFLVVAVAVAASATSLGNRFAFDDRWIILFNQRVQDLSRLPAIFNESYWPVLSNGLYRPLASVGYALQWAAGGGSPAPFHAVNVALYAGACLAVWRLALRVLPQWAALVAAMLFAAHPVHVEAVANIVGQAEIACTLLLAAATSLFIGWRRDGSLGASARAPGWPRIAALAALYAAATLYKEQGLVLPALLAAAELTVVGDEAVPRPMRARLAALRPLGAALVLVAMLLLMVRVRVLGAVGGDVPIPVLEGLGIGGRTLGMLGLVPEVVRLLLWPAALSADYGPRHVTWAPAWTVTGALGLMMVLGIVVAMLRMRRTAPAVTFGILCLAITYAPVSNVLLPSGILLAERTLFAPTVGVVLALGGLFAWLRERQAMTVQSQRLAGALLLAVVLAGTVHSARRQPVWRDNDTLFRQMVEDAPLSARAHYALGGHLFEIGRASEAEQEWRLAIALDTTAWRIRIDLADRYRSANLCPPAMVQYRLALAAVPSAERARTGLVECLRAAGDRAGAEQVAREALEIVPNARVGLRLLRLARAAPAVPDSAAAPAMRPPALVPVPRQARP